MRLSLHVMGRVSGWTNSWSLRKTPLTYTIGNLILRTLCQSSEMPTAHLFSYLVDCGTALSTQSSSSSIFFWKRDLFSAMAKTIRNINYFKFTTLLEYKFSATQNYWTIVIYCNAKLLDNFNVSKKNRGSQIQRMPTEYNKSHIQGILKKDGKIQYCINLYCFFRGVIKKKLFIDFYVFVFFFFWATQNGKW